MSVEALETFAWRRTVT